MVPVSRLESAGASSWYPCLPVQSGQISSPLARVIFPRKFRLSHVPIQKLSKVFQNRNETFHHKSPSVPLISPTTLFPSPDQPGLLLPLKHKCFLPTSGPLHLLVPCLAHCSPDAWSACPLQAPSKRSFHIPPFLHYCSCIHCF